MANALALLVLVLMTLTPSVARAVPEAACTALGANCLCSEPFQMTDFAHFPGNSFHNPNDSTTKECRADPGLPAGYAIIRNGWDYTVGTDSAILAKFPPGHQVQRFLKGSVSSGTVQIGHYLSAGDPHARIAHRIYLYFSPDFDFKYERDGSTAYYNATQDFNGVCQNTKWGESGPVSQGIHWDISESPAIYGFAAANNHTPAVDCCNAGPVNGVRNLNNVQPTSWKGKWWRIEFIIRNATGSPGIVYEAYRKNVTDNLPEEKLIGTDVACPTCIAQPWSTQAATQLTPAQRQDFVFSNQYRQDAPNYSCKGHYAWSHSLTAAWSTDAGQRVGAATEIEGGGGGPNVFDILATQGTYGLTGAVATLTQLAGPTLIGFVRRAVLIITIIALLLVLRRRRLTHVDRR